MLSKEQWDNPGESKKKELIKIKQALLIGKQRVKIQLFILTKYKEVNNLLHNLKQNE